MGELSKFNEPTVGTWVRDRFGATTMRHPGGGWAQPGFMPFGVWEAMWDARGPYVACSPWGADLPSSSSSSDPHLFIAKDAWDETSLWFGTGPDDRHCELVDLGGHGGSHPIAVRKALWEALAASPFVQDAADWTPDA